MYAFRRAIRRSRSGTPRLAGEKGASLRIHSSNRRLPFESSQRLHASTMLPSTVSPPSPTGMRWSHLWISAEPQKTHSGGRGPKNVMTASTSDFPKRRVERPSRTACVRMENPNAGVMRFEILGSFIPTSSRLPACPPNVPASAAQGTISLYSLPASRKLKYPVLLKMMWSSSSMPTISPAALSCAVMLMSLCDGSTPPLG